MTLPKDYISPTQLNMFLRCPMQYYFRYEEGLVRPPKSSLTRGKAVHKGQEVNYIQKIETRQDMPLKDVKEVVAAEFESLEPETEWEHGEDKGKVKDEAIGLSELYHKEIAPTVQPLLVEQKIELCVPEADCNLFGYIDLIDSTGCIRDTKTVSKMPNKAEADKSLQLTAYALAYRELMGLEESGVKLDYLIVAKKPKKPDRSITLESKRTKEDLDRYIGLLSRIVLAIKKKAYYPNPTNFMCSEKFCGYYHECRKMN